VTTQTIPGAVPVGSNNDAMQGGLRDDKWELSTNAGSSDMDEAIMPSQKMRPS